MIASYSGLIFYKVNKIYAAEDGQKLGAIPASQKIITSLRSSPASSLSDPKFVGLFCPEFVWLWAQAWDFSELIDHILAALSVRALW